MRELELWSNASPVIRERVGPALVLISLVRQNEQSESYDLLWRTAHQPTSAGVELDTLGRLWKSACVQEISSGAAWKMLGLWAKSSRADPAQQKAFWRLADSLEQAADSDDLSERVSVHRLGDTGRIPRLRSSYDEHTYSAGRTAAPEASSAADAPARQFGGGLPSGLVSRTRWRERRGRVAGLFRKRRSGGRSTPTWHGGLQNLIDLDVPDDRFELEETPALGDAYNFVVKVRCKWLVQGTAPADGRRRRRRTRDTAGDPRAASVRPGADRGLGQEGRPASRPVPGRRGGGGDRGEPAVLPGPG